MFDILGDEITYGSRTIARIVPTLALGLRREVEDEIICLATGPTEDEIEERINTAKAEAREEGRLDGIEEGKNDAKNELDDEREDIRNEAFDLGVAEGIARSANATDADRVELLLKALATIHDRMLPIAQGFKEPDKFKLRPAKIGEAKKAARQSLFDARRAIAEYRAPREKPAPAPKTYPQLENVFS